MSTIVIPMAGESRRFFEAGYERPKYMLPLWGRTVFAYAVGSFARYFESHRFVFVLRSDAGDDVTGFVGHEADRLGIRSYAAVPLRETTRGQAETVALGLEAARVGADESVTIFNIDTFRPGFRYAAELLASDCAGFLEVFVGHDPAYSFAKLDATGRRVVATAEKQAISDLCSTGLYHFARRDAFDHAYDVERRQPTCTLGELYVAPLYNHLIAEGAVIRHALVERATAIVCGVPADYELLRRLEPPVLLPDRGIWHRAS